MSLPVSNSVLMQNCKSAAYVDHPLPDIPELHESITDLCHKFAKVAKRCKLQNKINFNYQITDYYPKTMEFDNFQRYAFAFTVNLQILNNAMRFDFIV